MPFTDLLPFRQAPVALRKKKAQLLDVDDQKILTKLFKPAMLALGFTGSMTGRTNFETSPYDFDRIIQAIDTDSYVKQAFNKYKELIWKEGWEIHGENPEAVTYLYQRLDFMELSMGRPIQEFLLEISDQLAKFSNCFIAKARGDLAPYFPQKLDSPDGKDPIIGYYIVPAETIEILRDKNNRPKYYRQRLDENTSGWSWKDGTQTRQPTWKAEDMIHMYVDRKPGRAFGTPFVVTTLDDVVALRQIEEDIQNLVHRELFPLYKYKVGTEDHPAEPEEVEAAAAGVADLRTEGALVLPDRHDVEVIGADGMALDASNYLNHFKERVAIGLGLSPHHLGMSMNGGNRSMTDRLDVALYDKIKTYQRYLSSMLQLNIFYELLLEGGYDPINTPSAAGVSDRCLFKFNEIDVDTQVKKETHEMQKFTNNIASLQETRLEIGLDPDAEEEDLLLGLTARLQPPAAETNPKISTKPGPTNPDKGQQAPALPGAKSAAVPSKGRAGQSVQKPDGQAPSTGGRPNLKNTKKGIGNAVRPSNQFGRRSSPNIRRDDSAQLDTEYLNEIVDLLGD